MLRAGQLPPVEAISTALINDLLAAPQRFVLVLDDFQCIQDAAILQVFERLVTNLLLPNLRQPMHLALLTREDPALPLARLRANNQLSEVRARDLRFSQAETASFMNDVIGLGLHAAEIAALEARTEGWPAGLQLAALALQAAEPADAAGWIAQLSGSHRYILGYLTEEVLNRQTDTMRRFLLQTALLDRLNGELCDALTGQADGQARLEQLYRANLFLVPLDGERRWYRYHHLFARLAARLASGAAR